MKIYSPHRIGRTGPYTRWPTGLLDTEVTFGCFHYRQLRRRIEYGATFFIVDFNQSNIGVGTGVGADATADAGVVVNGDHSLFSHPVNSTSGTADQTDRVAAVHAGIGDHPFFRGLCHGGEIEGCHRGLGCRRIRNHRIGRICPDR